MSWDLVWDCDVLNAYRDLSEGTIYLVFYLVFVFSKNINGNFEVMVSFKIDKQLQTISNYFLFSLAVADIAIGNSFCVITSKASVACLNFFSN